MFRLLFVTFFGETRASHDVAHHIHESPSSMTLPLIVLAVLSVIGGYFSLLHFLSPLFGEQHEAAIPFLVKYLPTLAGLGGIGLAYLMYVANPDIAESLSRQFAGLHRILLNKWYIDEIYDAIIVRPLVAISDWLWQVWDVLVIDGTVNGTAHTVEANGLLLRLWQTGNVQNYALSFLVGAVVILGYYLW
jgi:NADH-quinone oxidoreductase subunit L